MSPSAAPVDPNQIANLIIMWSGVVLAGFTLLVTVVVVALGLAGFFGLREVRRIHKIRTEVDHIRTNLDEQLHQVVTERDAAVKASEDQSQRLTSKVNTATEQANARLRHVEDVVVEWEERLNTLDDRVTRQVEVSHLFSEGEDAYRNGRFEKAVEYLSRAARLDPENARIHYRLGRALTNLSEDTAAIAELRTAIELGMDTSQVKRGLAQAYRYAEPGTARTYAEDAVTCGADDAHSWNCLGLIRRDSGDFPGSVEAHTRAYEIKPDQATSLFYLALLEAAAHQNSRAQEHARGAAALAHEQEVRDQIKSVWTALIRWTNDVLHGEYPEADKESENLRIAVSSRRRAREVTEHVGFLLQALGREELRSHYIHDIERYWFGRTT